MKLVMVVRAESAEEFEIKLNATLKCIEHYNLLAVQTHVNYLVITEGEPPFEKHVYHPRFHAVIVYEVLESGEQDV